MAATREDVSRWFDEGRGQGATHMIVVCDLYDYEDYPYYVSEGEDVRTIAAELGQRNKIMEVYSLKKDKEWQLSEYRAFHYD